jgi:hypothetical protein
MPNNKEIMRRFAHVYFAHKNLVNSFKKPDEYGRILN